MSTNSHEEEEKIYNLSADGVFIQEFMLIHERKLALIGVFISDLIFCLEEDRFLFPTSSKIWQIFVSRSDQEP